MTTFLTVVSLLILAGGLVAGWMRREFTRPESDRDRYCARVDRELDQIEAACRRRHPSERRP